MLKKTKTGMIIGLFVAILAVSGCGSGSQTSNQASGQMDSDDLLYTSSKQYWSANGEKFTVEGYFYNVSSDYDVVALEDAVINMVDSDGNIVYTVNVNEDAVGKISHNGSFPYNFITDNIAGEEDVYGDYGLHPEFDGIFYYEECAKDSVTVAPNKKETCPDCGGTGLSDSKCDNCDGTGIEPSYDKMSSRVIRAFMDKECARCGGTGYKKCYTCNGTGTY